MKTALEQKLVTEFPLLYRQYNLGIRDTCMCWGFECPDEWFGVIYELSQKLTAYMETQGITIEAAQVKEKFGGLRFYLDALYCDKDKADEIYALVDAAEKQVYDLMNNENE